jgi:adenylate cyclase
MSHAGRHRTSLPPERRVASSLGEDIEARLLGQRRTMCIREVSDKASVSQRSARKLWHAFGLPDVGDDDPVFTDADLKALKSVAALVRDGVLDEPTALGMTMALARSTDRLALWQTRVMAESMGAESKSPDTSVTARAAASSHIGPQT